ELIACAHTQGDVPEVRGGGGVARLDILAQAVRAGLLIEAHTAVDGRRRRRLDALTDRLARAIGPDGAVPFAPGAHPPQFNVRAAMFAEQALALAQFEPNALARFAAAPCIV